MTPRGWEDLSRMLILYEQNGLDVDEDLIYNFTKSVYENKEYFLGVHSSFGEFDPDTMNEGTAIALHPGAERFYKEIGLM